MSVECTELENDLMRTALDASRIGLCVVAQDGNIVMLQGSVATSIFAPSETFIGQNYRRLFVTGMLPHGGQELFALQSPEVALETSVQVDGRQTVLLFQGRTVDKGALGRYRVVSVIDVAQFGTTRDRVFELRRQLDAINTAVVLVDARLPDMPIVSVNKRFEQLTGYDAEFAIGRNCRFLQGRARDVDATRKLSEAIKRQQSCHVVLQNVRKDGSSFVNELLISPVFDRAGVLTNYVGVQQEYSGRSIGPVRKPAAQ